MEQLSPDENRIIAAIVALAQQLPRPLPAYSQQLGELRRKTFGIPGRKRGEVTKGYIEGHQIRATSPEWRVNS